MVYMNLLYSSDVMDKRGVEVCLLAVRLTALIPPQVPHYQRHGDQVCGSDGKLPGGKHPFRLEEHLLSVSSGSVGP